MLEAGKMGKDQSNCDKSQIVIAHSISETAGLKCSWYAMVTAYQKQPKERQTNDRFMGTQVLLFHMGTCV